MLHDEFELTLAHVDWIETEEEPVRPTLAIRSVDSPACLKKRLTRPDSALLEADEIDVTFRYPSPLHEYDTRGVLAVSSNVTGDFVLEASIGDTLFQNLVQTARYYGDVTGRDTTYAVWLVVHDELLVEYEKQILLVYGADGTLLRHHSLIPNGIEI